MKRVGCLAMLLLAGCAPRPAPKAEVPAAPAIHRIAVLPIQGEGGAEATRVIVQALKGSGVDIVADQNKADALLSGQVTDYQARQKSTLFLGPTQIQSSADTSSKSSNPIFSLHSAQNVAQISAMNPGNPQMVTENAVVGLSIRLQDASHRQLVWSDAYTYEMLDLASALQKVAWTLARSLQISLPGLTKKS
jgi:TolB-like protein